MDTERDQYLGVDTPSRHNQVHGHHLQWWAMSSRDEAAVTTALMQKLNATTLEIERVATIAELCATCLRDAEHDAKGEVAR